MANQKFKSKIQADAGLQITSESPSKVLQLDPSGNVQSSVTTTVELAHLAGVTSPVQTQLTDAQSDATQAILDAAAAQVDATQALTNAATSQSTVNTHISNPTGAHAASAISVTPAGNIVSTDVQSALQEIQLELDAVADITQDVADLVSLSGVAANAVNLGVFSGTIIPDASTVKSALQSLETTIETLPDPMEYKGLYDADTNTPTLADGTGSNGDVYQVTVAGTVDFGSGNISFLVGDKVVYNGSISVYEKWDMTDAVISVNGQNGIVVLSSDNITEGVTNLYFTEERAQDAVGTILVDSTSVDLSYDDVLNQINAVVLPAGVDHDALANFVVNEHIDHSTVEIQTIANSGLIGGGNITATRSLSVDISGTTALGETPAAADSFLVYDASTSSLKKVLYSEVLGGVSIGSVGDISETSDVIVNNQSTALSVVGLAFSATVVRGFKALVTVEIDATVGLFEAYEMTGINKAGSFEMSVSSVGDDSSIVFTITSAGQIEYTSADYTGFVSGAIKFRAETTTV